MTFRRRAIVAFVVALGAAFGAVALIATRSGEEHPAPPKSAAAQPAPPRARAAGVQAHLRALAAVARRHQNTRAAGTSGDRATADYIAGRLRQAGYAVTRQPLRIPFFRQLAAPRVITDAGPLPGGSRSVRLLHFSPGGTVSGRVRATGLGCTARHSQTLRRGEIALVRRGQCTFRRKAQVAQTAGAVALLLAERPGQPAVRGTLGRPGLKIPALSISDAAARRLTLGGNARVEARAISVMRRTDNVLASPKGNVTRRFVLVGAHLDSVPAGPGINDNASGVAAALDIAERLAARVNVAFGFWAAEEVGLIGSRRYVARLDSEGRRAILAYLNLDMVGSPRPRPAVYAAGSDPISRRLERLLRRALAKGGVSPRVAEIRAASDHAAFARVGIPVSGLFTGAGPPADPCYHRRCDGLANVDMAITGKMATAARRAVTSLASP